MIRRHVLLKQGKFYIDGDFTLCDVKIAGSTISEIGLFLRPRNHEIVVPLEGNLVVPGLINSHDHLEFNLFPHLGKPPYKNYVDWSEDIQRNHRLEIREILRIPLRLRLVWGAYKNIFSGVTTVVHHNRYYCNFRLNYPVDVFKNYVWIHSLRLEKRDLRNLISSKPKRVFIHLAEGTDSVANAELSELVRLGGLSKNTFIIHGVGLQNRDVDAIEAAGATLVWCPSSNLYLFGRTAPVETMAGRIPFLLGTDSTLTGPSSLFEELRLAQKLSRFSSRDLLKMVTETPARLLGLNKGNIRVGAQADLLVYEARHNDPFQSLVNLTPPGVVCLFRKGKPIFGHLRFARAQFGTIPSHQRHELEGAEIFLTGNLNKLIERIRSHAPGLSLGNWNLPKTLQIS